MVSKLNALSVYYPVSLAEEPRDRRLSSRRETVPVQTGVFWSGFGSSGFSTVNEGNVKWVAPSFDPLNSR
jgi:hypothetical protein